MQKGQPTGAAGGTSPVVMLATGLPLVSASGAAEMFMAKRGWVFVCGLWFPH